MFKMREMANFGPKVNTFSLGFSEIIPENSYYASNGGTGVKF